ncbi:MAG: exonuclease SbcCD subunit D [Pirellulaceae bacterium]
MPAFSFVHSADLHLDSPFLGLGRLPEGENGVVQELREATFRAFDSVIDLCICRKADFLLVAGDVYDGADRSLQAQLRFRNGLRRLIEAGIRAYVVHGNHDPLDGWADSLQMPDGVHGFGPELDSVVFEKEGVPVARIHGISYPTRKIGKRFGKGFQRRGDEPFQIGLFHCNAGGDTRYDPYAPRSVSELAESNLNYWALGHIHESVVLRKADPFVGYPGNTQGRHINEAGPRGCFFVRVTAEGNLEAEPDFVATDTVRWLVSDVAIEGLETMESLLERIDEKMDELAGQAEERPVVTRITFRGRGPLHRSLARPSAARDLLDELHDLGTARTPFIWVEKLVLRTRPQFDLDARREAQDFLGDLLRLIDDIRRSPDEMADLQGVLADLYEHRRASKILDPPDEDALRILLDEAESRCADLLLQEDD